jgi:hypothetical protein
MNRAKLYSNFDSLILERAKLKLILNESHTIQNFKLWIFLAAGPIIHGWKMRKGERFSTLYSSAWKDRLWPWYNQVPCRAETDQQMKDRHDFLSFLLLLWRVEEGYVAGLKGFSASASKIDVHRWIIWQKGFG